MSLFDFKDFLTLDEVGEYLVDNSYPDIGKSRVITLAKDLINEGKLSTAIYYRGQFNVELVFHHKDKEKVVKIERIKQEVECYLNTYSWLTEEYQHKLFKNDLTIEKGVSIKDFEEQRLYLEPNIKEYQLDFVGDTKAEYCNLFIDDESYVLKLDDVRYYRPDLDKLFKKDSHLMQPTIEQYKQHISELDNKLEKAKAELAVAKTMTTAQPLNWQNMSEHIYPPELHLSMMIWQRIYADEELKASHPHITSHAGKFELIAKRMNLEPTKELGKRIEKITNIAYTKNGQTLLAVPLHAIKELHMPPLKEKTTS